MKSVTEQQQSERLGIKLDTLYPWVSKAKSGKTGFSEDPGNVPITDPKQLKQLEKELWEAREKIEILEDALGFFCKKPKEIAKKYRMVYITNHRRQWPVANGMVLHSDCSKQFTSKLFRAALKKVMLIQSNNQQQRNL